MPSAIKKTNTTTDLCGYLGNFYFSKEAMPTLLWVMTLIVIKNSWYSFQKSTYDYIEVIQQNELQT